MRALGYLGAGSSPGEPPPGLADPKDRLAVRDLLTAGEERFSEARLRLATLELDAGDLAVARRAVEEAIAASPQAKDRVLADRRLAQLLR